MKWLFRRHPNIQIIVKVIHFLIYLTFYTKSGFMNHTDFKYYNKLNKLLFHKKQI